jgi:hypothetical protein
MEADPAMPNLHHPTTGRHGRLHRRDLLRLGLLGLSLPEFFARHARADTVTGARGNLGKAKACIVLYCWGGVSHLDTWDPKPDAPAEVRGEFRPIATSVPGIRVGEHMPLLARRMHHLAVVRSINHQVADHGKGMYWNMTGHPPPPTPSPGNPPPSVQDRPNLGAMVSRLRRPRGLPGAVQLPYPLVDNGTLQSGDGPGWLGQADAPVLLRPDRGQPYGGVSRDLGALVLEPGQGLDSDRIRDRAALARKLERLPAGGAGVRNYEHFQEMALDLLLSPKVRATLDLDREDVRVRDKYGPHLCGSSVLLARRLVGAGVPLVTVICAAGDLNNGAGDHWDTHGDNFNRLKKALLPPLEQASAALLDDLETRGMLEQTLVVWLTEFGRTPKVSGGGRNHYPFCYSVALAGGGIRGGQVYGSSDRLGAHPRDLPCGPNDLHATIFQALGIPLDSYLEDYQGRPQALTDGRPLPLF